MFYLLIPMESRCVARMLMGGATISTRAGWSYSYCFQIRSLIAIQEDENFRTYAGFLGGEFCETIFGDIHN